jgi:hypothetical protein
MTNNNISKCEADWGFVPYTDIDTLIKTIAKTAIRKNLVRKNNDFYNFTNREIHCMNHNYKGEEPMNIEGGYVFLDDDGGNEGMVRLYIDDCNPKWSFWVEDDKIYIDWA